MTKIKENIPTLTRALDHAKAGHKVLFFTRNEARLHRVLDEIEDASYENIVFSTFDISSSIEKVEQMVDLHKPDVLAIEGFGALYRVGNDNSFSAIVGTVYDKLRSLCIDKRIMLITVLPEK